MNTTVSKKYRRVGHRGRDLGLGRLAFALAVLGGLLALAWMAYTALAPGGSSAFASATLACSVKASCGAGEVAVFRMSSTSNAHAGTPGGSAYGSVVCCGGVHNLSGGCSAVYDRALTLSAANNAHAAADGSYAAQICLSVPHGVADCTYGPSCAVNYQCLATVSGSSNAHVADCDGAGDYATKLCCYVEDDNDNDGMLDPADLDDDNDGFEDDDEAHVGTDPWDACRDDASDDAWPPDINIDTWANILDVLLFKPVIMTPVPPGPARFDLNADNNINILDVLLYKPIIMTQCTNP